MGMGGRSATSGGAVEVALAESDTLGFAISEVAEAEFVEEGGVLVLEAIELDAVHLAADVTFDGGDEGGIACGHEGEGIALGLGATGATDAVDVIFGVFGDIVIDDVGDVGDVEATGGDVGGNECFVVAVLEAFECLLTFLLAAVGVDDRGLVPGAFEEVHDFIGAALGTAEDDDGFPLDLVEEGEEQGLFLGEGHGIHDVADGVGGLLTGADLDADGIVEGPGAEGFDGGRDGGGEEEGLPLFGTLEEDAADIGKETHVEHAVGLIEHDIAGEVEAEGALAEVIQESARGGDHDIDAIGEGFALGTVTDAAVDEAGTESGELAELEEIVVGLLGEFAGGFEDETTRAGSVGAETAEDGEGKCGGLAGAGLGGSNDVLAFEEEWDGLLLDRGGLDVAQCVHCVEDRRPKAQF